MKKVHVQASRSYDVIIGSAILQNAASYIGDVKMPCAVAVVSDTNVWPLYGSSLQADLECSGYRVVSFVFEAGEASKNAGTYLEILNFLAQNHVTRSDLVIALGGGVVGDMAGFAAATYLRGIDYIQIPTSLLAMVDSSVGGKTAIDLPAGKNLVGAFCQPKLVLCDIDALSTLPQEVFTDGCAEVIKYGVLYDEALFCHLEEHKKAFDRAWVIGRCVELKRDVVAQDEFDTGARQQLNLGHTIGHAVEANSSFTVTHGQAVAIGMAIVSKGAWKAGICEKTVHTKIVAVLKSFGLPVVTKYDAQALYTNALSDKKRAGGNVNLILPQKIGQCITKKIPVTELKAFIESGL